MRVAVACVMHETNTFSRESTSLELFNVALGNEVDRIPFWKGRCATRGILERLRARAVETLPTFFARAIPSGLVEARAYKVIRNRILEALRALGPLDGICLSLHGSMSVEGEDDPEGDLLVRIRQEVGPGVPITCALDMHATVTARMVRHCDAMAAYLTAPHLDEYETGVRAADLLLAGTGGGERLSQASVHVPMLLAGEQSETDAEPMRHLMGLRRSLCDRAGLLDASYCLGFPWADSPHAGVSAIVVGRESQADSVRATARSMASSFWERRGDFHFTTEAYPLEAALDQAVADPRLPIIVSDSGDNPTAGASQDGVRVLASLLARPLVTSLVSAVADRRAFDVCRRAGEGAQVSVEVGRMGPDDPRPVPLKAARVRRLVRFNGAAVAVLEAGAVHLILCDRRVAVFEPSLIHFLGLEPRRYKVIVVKCGYQGPEYRAIGARSILALTPGDSNEDLPSLTYRRVPRPIFPLDPDTSWTAPGS